MGKQFPISTEEQAERDLARGIACVFYGVLFGTPLVIALSMWSQQRGKTPEQWAHEEAYYRTGMDCTCKEMKE